MKKIFYLSSCSTCKRILKVWQPSSDVDLQDLKKTPLDAHSLAQLYEHTGSYEALINKRAQFFKQNNRSSKSLSESESRELLLTHYSLLKRPVLVLGAQIFIGNSPKTVSDAQKALHK